MKRFLKALGMALAVAIPVFEGIYLFGWLLLNHTVVFVILFLLGFVAYLTRSAYKFLKKEEEEDNEDN